MALGLLAGGAASAIRKAAGEAILKHLYRPIRPGLDRTEKALALAAESGGHVIRPMARHLMRRPGKRIRAALVLFSAKAGRRAVAPDRAAGLAAAVEMLHMASLVHDDILDGAATRRNQPSLHAEWGVHRSVLMGDWLFAATFRSMAETYPLAVTRSLLTASQALCDGEIEETAVTFDASVPEERYLDIIGKKTAALMAGACESGALLTGATPRHVSALRHYGYAFGMAFQLIDDALNFSGDEQEVGKPVGSDIVEGKFTMPVLSLRDSLRGAERGHLLDLLTEKSLSNGGARRVTELVRERGGVDRTLQRAEVYLREALGAVADLPAPARDPLTTLASYALDRRT